MQRINLKITRGYRWFLYGTLTLSVMSGGGFWLIRRFGQVEGEFGLESSPWQYPLLQAHGLAAFLMLMAFGAVAAAHIPPAWFSRRNRWLGCVLATAVSLSALSAYVLYYWVGDDWHEWLGNAHALVGLSLPLWLIWHVQRARRQRRVNPLNYA